MRTRTDTTIFRRNLTLHSREANSLDTLRVRTEAQSDSEVIRNALRYYQRYAEDRANGKQLFVANDDGQPREILIPEDAGATAGGVVRRNLMLHELSMKRLDSLRGRTGASSDSEVIRRALCLYEILIDESSQGGEFFVGQENDLHGVILGNVASRGDTPFHHFANARNGVQLVVPL